MDPLNIRGLAVEDPKFFNIQFKGYLISRFVAMGMSVEDGVRVQGIN
jgi:hypothetical protein